MYRKSRFLMMLLVIVFNNPYLIVQHFYSYGPQKFKVILWIDKLNTNNELLQKMTAVLKVLATT